MSAPSYTSGAARKSVTVVTSHTATSELQFLVETPDETFPAYPCFNEWWYFRQVSRVDDQPASLHS
jgi:hypothetical protein